MTTPEAKKIILMSIFAIVGLTFVREVRAGDLPSTKVVIGGFMGAALLSALAGPAPQVAGGLALTTLVTAALTDRATIQALAGVTTNKETR